MILAQLGNTTSGDAAIWTGVAGIFLVFAKDWMKDRREREEGKRRDEYLKDIATTNREAMKSLHDVSDNQIAAREEIVAAKELSRTRHEQIIGAIDHIPCVRYGQHFKEPKKPA